MTALRVTPRFAPRFTPEEIKQAKIKAVSRRLVPNDLGNHESWCTRHRGHDGCICENPDDHADDCPAVTSGWRIKCDCNIYLFI